MRAVALKRHAAAEQKMARRHVFSTDHPSVFEVISSDAVERYTIVVVPSFDLVPTRLLCSCVWGINTGLVPVDAATMCWHLKLVIQRRFSKEEAAHDS